MKKSKFGSALVLAIGLTLSLPSSAGLFDTVATSGWDNKEVSAKYKLKSYGYPVRAYEWTPKYNKNVRCVFIAGSESLGGGGCYNVEESKKVKVKVKK